MNHSSHIVEIRQTTRFARWLGNLRDQQARLRIATRIRRMELGNPGDVEPVGGGVSEMRIAYGPGYRLYFVSKGRTVVVLLCGGDKSSQDRDISLAKQMAKEF